MNILFIIFSALIGLIVGSFLNCLAWRLYQEESIMGRSYCPNCRHKVSWYDNIPILSFILLKGRCRHCQSSISWQYPLTEFFTALLFVLSFLADSALDQSLLFLVRDWLLISGLVLVFIYDWRWQSVPMLLIWPLTALIAVLNLFLGFSWQDLALFGLVGTLFFLIQYLATKGRGLGTGDIWLGLLIGISFPRLDLLALVLIISYFTGAIVSAVLLISKKKELKSKIALGPFLSFGSVITLIYGFKIINWYLGIF
jgi:leader peptidase (prepilin peptidase) / N-methyltransferase